MLLAGCQERQLYPLEDLSADRLESILFFFSDGQEGGYSQEILLQESQMDDVVETLRELRMTSEIERGYVGSGSGIILIYSDGQGVEIRGDIETAQIENRFYLWPRKSYEAFDGLIQAFYCRSILTAQVQETLILFDKIGMSYGYEQLDGNDSGKW